MEGLSTRSYPRAGSRGASDPASRMPSWRGQRRRARFAACRVGYPQTMTTVAELIVTALADAGVKQVWGVVGDALNPVTDAIRRDDRIEWVGVRHEEVAAFAVSAQAQLTGTIGVCMGTVGPGCGVGVAWRAGCSAGAAGVAGRLNGAVSCARAGTAAAPPSTAINPRARCFIRVSKMAQLEQVKS